jgi:single-stranded-DNA-specific exonuclease
MQNNSIQSRPKPTLIKQKHANLSVYEGTLNLGFSELQARLVANRLDTTEQLEEILLPKLKHIQPPSFLKNIDHAVEIIAKAIQSDGFIVLATDYDTDGVTSAWVATRALQDYFGVKPSRIKHVIGERQTGYGITPEVVERILEIEGKIDLVISADQGSSDEEQIAQLKSKGISVCVTDHHQIPVEGPPKSALCTVNPQQAGCEYDKTIAGCFVIFLVMSHLRSYLIKNNIIAADTPSLKALASSVALGTVADSVSLKTPNNRAIVKAGLAQINRFDTPSWQAMYELSDNFGKPYDSEFLGFQVATRINAASRVSDVTTAFNFLNASEFSEAYDALKQLDADNQNRREQQSIMLDQAMVHAASLYHENKFSLVLKLNGNPGIQGIIASRVGEFYGVPTIAMTDLEDGRLAGSARAIVNDIDLREAFQAIANQDETIFESMGGHKGAAGCMIRSSEYERFSDLFEAEIKKQLHQEPPQPFIYSDGSLDPSQLNIDLVDEINALEPFGREWSRPIFDGFFVISHIRLVGQQKNHVSCQLNNNGQTFRAIFFNAINGQQSEFEFGNGQAVHCVYQPELNRFAGTTQLQLRIIKLVQA